MRRVAITGLGVVSALGVGTERFWAGVRAGASGVRRITRFDPSGFLAQAAAEVCGFDATAYFEDAERELLDPFAHYALVAADEAWRRAAIHLSDIERDRAGVIIGSAMGGVTSQDDGYRRLYAHNHSRLHPYTVPRVMINAAAGHISMRYGLRGPVLATGTACAAAAHAVGEAAEMIRAGRAELMIAGGADILAELAGYGATADAGHLTQPGLEAPVQAIALALAQAQLAPDAIDYVNAHGTGTRLNDSAETTIVKRAFGAHAARLAISSTKPMHGHAMGASGGLELVATVLAMRHGLAPPTINYDEPDPECDLDYVPNAAREMPIRAAMSNSFAFGGLNAALAVRRV